MKLNSSDGVPGGLSEEDSLQVATRLSELGVDIDLARPLVRPDLTDQIIDHGYRGRVEIPWITTRVRFLDKAFGGVLVISWYDLQMQCIARGKPVVGRGDGREALAFALRRHDLRALVPRRAGGHEQAERRITCPSTSRAGTSPASRCSTSASRCSRRSRTPLDRRS